VQDGVAFVGKTDTYANNTAFAEAYNSQVLIFGGNALVAETLHKGPVILKPADCVMSTFMAVRSKRLTEGALISGDIVARNGILDNVGGPALASLPYFNTVDRRAKVPTEIGLTYTQAEEYDLADAGFTVFGINAAGNSIIFRDVVTTYKTDSAGNANVSFKYLNYVDTGSVCREILFNSAKANFAQTRLTPGSLEFGRNMENAGSIKAHYLEVLRELGALALLASGADAELEMSDGTIVTIDTANRSASVAGPIILVTQLGTITYTLQFQFASATA
jgi:phage tail sheath gpL-like